MYVLNLPVTSIFFAGKVRVTNIHIHIRALYLTNARTHIYLYITDILWIKCVMRVTVICYTLCYDLHKRASARHITHDRCTYCVPWQRTSESPIAESGHVRKTIFFRRRRINLSRQDSGKGTGFWCEYVVPDGRFSERRDGLVQVLHKTCVFKADEYKPVKKKKKLNLSKTGQVRGAWVPRYRASFTFQTGRATTVVRENRHVAEFASGRSGPSLGRVETVNPL
jgi:hypothetical protein